MFQAKLYLKTDTAGIVPTAEYDASFVETTEKELVLKVSDDWTDGMIRLPKSWIDKVVITFESD